LKNDTFLSSGAIEHANITVFENPDAPVLSKRLKEILNDQSYKILLPPSFDVLKEAAQNSGLVLIDLDSLGSENLNIAHKLREDRLIVCDIGAIASEESHDLLKNNLYLQSFDFFFSLDAFNDNEIKKIITRRLDLGSERLRKLIQDEEYRRFKEALSCAPTSVMVFDGEKRIVFVSEHYFRVYPKSAPRLCRGLSVIDAFEMMSKEEKVDQKSELYQRLREFWYTLNGEIEFSLDTGVSYRLTATPLSNHNGTIVTAVNISNYINQRTELNAVIKELNALKSAH
jgi:PAS domain-containing protein